LILKNQQKLHGIIKYMLMMLFYLEAAKRSNLPLLTFDGGIRRIGQEIGITVLGGLLN
jgi:hypothetical protein